MKTYKSVESTTFGLRKSKITLPQLSPLTGSNETGIAVTSYGQGQVAGLMYTVPAHGEIEVDFKLKLLCITPEDIQNLSNLIKSLLDASQQHSYSELSKTEISGGASFFGFFGWGGASASYSDTKQTMDSFGLSETNQQAIVKAMMAVAQQVSEFNYKGTVHNEDFDYDVTGSLFGIVMDATIQQGDEQHQVRFLAPNVHLRSSEGDNIPVVNQLYSLNN